MINVIPHGHRETVIYRGQVAQSVTASTPGDRALIVDGKRVPNEELDAWYDETVLFDWRGQPFGFWRCEDGYVSGGFRGHDSAWARDNGLEGDQYQGWVLLNVPENEITNLRVEKSDILKHERYRHTFNVDPPPNLFVDVRPATDQEWTRG